MKILIVEDHQPTAESLEWYLKPRYQVEWAHSCHSAQQRLEAQPFDLLLLDLSLPDGKGTSLCEERISGQRTPAIIISGHQDTRSKVSALDAGADDYLTKPFTPPELLARVRAVLRRYTQTATSSEETELQVGQLILKCREQQAIYKGARYQLTHAETALLKHFLRHGGQLLDKNVLVKALALEGSGDAFNTLEARIRKLRRRLCLSKRDLLIETVYGLGYRLNPRYA